MKMIIQIIAIIMILVIGCSTPTSQRQQTILKGNDEIMMNEKASPQYKYETVVYYDVPLDQQYQNYIRTECGMANIDIELVYAIMKVESEFNSLVVSSTDDYGIMQINQCNHENLKKELGINDFLDPYDNARAGIYMLSHLTWCENETQMLMCYNMGTAGAKRAWSSGIYETSYSRKVLKAKEEIGGLKYEVEILCD